MPIPNVIGNDSMRVLASLNEQDDILFLFENKDPKLRQICWCESSYRPEVCSFAGCYSGMGLCGFIPSTWNTVLLRMTCSGKYDTENCVKANLFSKCNVPIKSVAGFETDKSHPVFDAECNVILADWLYQRDGDSHWNSSKSCWSE